MNNHFLAYPSAGRQCRGSHPKILERGIINIFNLRTEQPSFHATNPQDSQQYRFVYLAELSLGYNFGYIQMLDLSMEIIIFRYDFLMQVQHQDYGLALTLGISQNPFTVRRK